MTELPNVPATANTFDPRYFAAIAKWGVWALLESYVSETPGPGQTQRILDYFKLGKIALNPDEATAWCAIFANAALESCGIAGTKSAAALSFSRSQLFRKLPGPALFAINVWERTPFQGQGHVNFYTGETETAIYGIGGNQGDEVDIDGFPRRSKSMRFVGHFWPTSLPVPTIKPIMLGQSPVYGSVSVT